MKKSFFLLLSSILFCSAAAQDMPMTTSSALYPNVLTEMGLSSKEVNQRFDLIVHDLFEGPNRIYFEVGDTMGYISDLKNNDVRTEGMSYGMMAAVQLDRKDMFDRLWRWTRRYMQHRSGSMEGYFAWSCKTDGTRNAQGPASDGELYFITSLLFASNQWGNSTGIDYKGEARYILDCMMKKNGTDNVFPLINPENHLITFTPTGFGARFTDPSYHIPAFYEVWARFADDGRQAYWNECAKASRAYLHQAIDSITGLNPDYSNYDGTPLEFKMPEGRPLPPGFVPMNAFRYDSWRVPMNIVLDYVWNGGDGPWQRKYAATIQNFFFRQGVSSFVDQYNVDGSTVKDTLQAGSWKKTLRHSLGLVATLASTAVIGGEHREDFVSELWKSKHEPYADGYFDAYYDGFLQLFAYMHLTGRYKMIYDRSNRLEAYLQPVKKGTVAQPDADGFIRRWRLAHPIVKPNRSNIMFTDSYIRKAFADHQPTADHTWYWMDSQHWNVKLFRLATGMDLNPYGNIFWVETTIDCPSDMTDVRLAVGSNSASMWWVNGEEAAILSGDRRMVMDDVLSPRLTLRRGKNVIKGAIINGPGMSDFCVRLLDEKGMPIKSYSVK